MDIRGLIECLPKKKIFGNVDKIEIERIDTDSRKAEQGSLFVALKGENANGEDHIFSALKKGVLAIVTEREDLALAIAAKGEEKSGSGGGTLVKELAALVIVVPNVRKALSLLASRFYGDPWKKVRVIGVTGTNGKTTTTRLLASILKVAGKKTGIIGTLGADFDGRHYPTLLTSPDPVEHYGLLSEMVESGVEYCVEEVSAHALYYDKEFATEYYACIATNLTQDHLDFFQTMERYGEAKKKLFTERKSGFAIVNADDDFFRKIAVKEEGVVTYAVEGPSDVFCVVEEESADGSLILMNLCDELCETQVKLIGRYNVYNALAAAACAWKTGVTMDEIARGVASVKSVEGRVERVGKYRGADIFVDFAHTPDGLEKTLSALKRVCRGRLILVFGCGGDRDRTKRPLMGAIAEKYADHIIITSDNPRSEDPCAIMEEIERGITTTKEYVLIEDRAQAIVYAIERLKEGDLLLVAGKGAEKYQEIMGIKYEFSDDNVIKKVIG